MANKEKTWEERIAHARAVNSQKKSAGVNNAPAVKAVSASSGQTKSWDDRIAHAKRVNAAKKLDEQKKLINSNEYKWASENEKRLKSGLGYNVNNGQIYSFEPITRDSLQKSIAWADNEIKKLKEKGATTDWFTSIGNFGLMLGGMEPVNREELNQQLFDLQNQRAVYEKYLENAEYEEAMSEIKKNGDGERFSELFAIDSRKGTLFDALVNIGSGGNATPTRNVGDIEREAEIKAELQGKYGEKFDKYRDLYAKGANSDFTASLVKKMEDTLEEHPVLGTIGYTLSNVVTAPVRGIGAVSDSLNKATGNYGASSGSLFQDMSEATVQKVNENINNTFKNDFAAGFVRTVYNAAVSGAESMMTMGTFGKFGEAILGLNAATSTYKAGKERGLSDGQALANGIAAGIFETLFEHISLEKLRAFQASPSTTLKPFIKNVLKQSFSEGMEEFGTDIANEAYDYFVNGGLSQYEQALRSGVSSKEYGQQFIAQLGETFITGALAGGGMIGMSAAPSAVSGSVSQVLTDKAVGSNIRQYGDVEKTISTAREQGGSLGKKAAKIEKQIAEGESVSDRRIGKIDRKTTKIERAKAVDTILAGKDFKDISGKEKRAIRSSVLTYLSSGGQVAYEQAEVLETENGRKALEAAQRWEIDKVLEIEAERIERRSTNIRKALDDNNTETLVKNTFSAVNAEGHKVSVGAVRSITDGEFEVVQDAETGATAKLSELKIEDRQARELYKNLQELATGENPLTVDAVNVALSMYNTLDNTSARAYSLWVHDAYKAGSVSIKNTVLSFPEFEEMFHKKYDGDIKEQQLREIYEIGARNLKVNPGVTRIGRKGLSKLQAEQVFILHERAKQLGLEIVLTDGRLTDENGKPVNALYIEGTNRIVMSLQNDLGLTLVHAGHEIFHWGKSQNKANGEYLQNMVIGVLKSDSKYDFDGIYKQVSAEYEGISEEAILEEIAAQYLGVVFANEDSIRKTVATATAEQKSFLQKMVDYLKDFIKSIKKLIDLYGDRDKTVRAAVTTPTEQLQYIADTFEEVLRKTAEIKKPATETGGVKYSYAGKTEDGIEVYETSQELQGKSYKEKLEIFEANFYKEDSPHYLGQRIAFEHDGKIDYAEIDRFTQKENIKKINPGRLYPADKAKINIGASGDFVTLLENALYDTYKTNDNFTKNDAHKKTKEFEYYLKTVYVDNVPFDVVINVRKEFSSEGFVYEVKFKKNKEFSLLGPQIENINRRPKVQNTRVAENSKKSLTQHDTDVKKKYSRQLLNDTWDDIRDKMYENEVHEDIIGEIEAYIKKLTTRKLARETAVTEGLIPKYEAILKVAREYTKGSDVSAQQLADTINDLMWAANDGNLDTKQFISTVKLIAEDIIRTGSQINDDMYREYEEFRKMTREETVYVSQQVYNQYVEEYSTRQNLNRACAGKIKIKPYDNNNRTGRALDDFYAELLERFPKLLPEDADIYHQLFEILNAWQMIQPWTEYRTDMLGINSRADLEHQSLIMAEEILSEVLGIKETVKTIADKYSDKLKYHQEHYKEYYRKQAEEGRRRRRESENIAVLNKRILRNTSRLSDMLRNETDTRHIPEAFKDAVMDFLNIIVVKNEDGRDVYHIKNGTLNMVKLGNAYASYYNPAGEDGREMTQYDEDVARWIEELAIVFGDNIEIKTLSLENLSKVDNIVTHFCHIIKHENEMFVNGRNEKFTSWATGSINEMLNHIKKPEYAAEKMILDAEHGMLTPIYFFKTIGTTTKNGTVYEERLFKMFRDLQNGQDKWYRNIAVVKKQLAEIKERYHYSEDWKRATTEFTLVSGETIKLTAEEIMYMRALNIRETGHINRLCHLLEGGIIVENDGRLRKFAERKQGFEETKHARKDFEEKGSFSQDDIKDALKKNLTREDLIAIFATLTEEQEQYSEALVEMMSTTGADLGNEVSRELFGIRKFTEKNYIPISVAESFLQFSVDKKAGGNIRLKNRSFTKRTTQNANATVYVRSITDVAAEHMQEMSLYNAMTIPIENFTRVFNYQKPVQEEFDAEGNVKKTTGNSYKEIFEAVYGERGVKYFEDFLRDMNGGNQTTSRDFMSKMMSMYKKSAVTGSLSVAVQQPSALVRAMALVDPKYFFTKPYSKEDYLEMLEYCPVAGIKEIGRFDTGTGLTATEWILDESGGIKDRADALLSYLPGWMDRRTWVYIWEAVKKETADKTKLKGEELLEEAARRFRDVIDYTQVYDSTLSRSAFMRDKGTGAKMATAFMAEPTLSYNLLRDGAINVKNAPKQAIRNVGAFTAATLLNTFLKSFITALRKDDEETNYGEVYLEEAISNFISDIDPINMLPVIKDIINIVKGYDVSRPDMNLIANLVNSGRVISNKLSKGKIPTWEECLTLVGTATAFTGVPLNNVFKEFIAVTGTVLGFGKSPGFSIKEVFPFEALKKPSDSVRLYRAILRKDEDAIERYKTVDEEAVKKYRSQGYSDVDALNRAMDNAENNFHNKVVDGLVSEDIRIKEAAEARLEADTKAYEALISELTKDGFDRNDVIRAVEKYISSMEDKTYESSEETDKSAYAYGDLFNAINADKMSDAKHIFDKLSQNVSKETVQENIRDEYAQAVYRAILGKDKAETERFEKIFEEFNYDYHYAVILGLKENDLRIYEAAVARYNGENAEYESIMADIVSDGFDENDVFNAIESETEKLAPDEEKEESHPEDSYLYEPADLKRYAKAYQYEATKKAIQNFRDCGKEDGDIRKSLTEVFKPQYKEAWITGNYTEIEKIRNFLVSLDVGYKESNFNEWEKEANSKE